MRCESFRNRLLSLPSPTVPTPELAAHLAACAGCRKFAKRAGQLDSLVAALPVPSSAARKQTFLESIAAFGPIIQTRPSVPSQDPHSGHFRPFRALARRMELRYAIAVAAAMLLAVSTWLMWPTGVAPVVQQDLPRLELLAKQNRHLATLASANSAEQRLTVWAEWTTDLRVTTSDCIMAADPEDFASLERLFQKSVQEGVVRQAEKLSRLLPARERVTALKNAQQKLADAGAELERLRSTAPATHQAGLERMAGHARKAQLALAVMAEGV